MSQESENISQGQENPVIYELSEIATHKTLDSAWIVLHNNVYDVTTFLKEHPGGPEILLDACGKDSSEEFDDIGHSQDAKSMLKKYKIGQIKEINSNKKPTNLSKCTIS